MSHSSIAGPIGSYQVINIVSTLAATLATQAHDGWVATQAPVAHHINLGDLGALGALHMAREMLRQRPTPGGFDAWADHIMELVTIAQKTIQPSAS